MLAAGSRELLEESESTQPEVDKLLSVVMTTFKILSDPCGTKISNFSAKKYVQGCAQWKNLSLQQPPRFLFN